MTCPGCGAGLVAGQDRCPACATMLAPPLEGALAPDPRTLAPPPGERGEPLREIPGLRKREKTWKDEVRERVRQRRRVRSGGEDVDLPPFEEDDESAEPPEPEASRPLSDGPGADPYALTERHPPPALGEILADLVLRPQPDPALDEPAERHRDALPPRARERPPAGPEDVVDAAEPEREWVLDTPEAAPLRPVERPALAAERIQAAVVDLALLLALWSVVVYFASRAAHVPVLGLLSAWPYLGTYLAALGLGYAAYFTGTTGQTVGKMALGLRVVDTAGRPPGYLRALLRAAVAAPGLLLAGAGFLTIFFDPARRGLHDWLLGTRVVKS